MLPRIRATARRIIRGERTLQLESAQADHEAASAAERESKWQAAADLYRAAMIKNFENPDHQLRLAMMLDRLKRGDEAKAHALVAIDSTLSPRYDAKSALRVHPTFFAARHEMAEFILDHHAELQTRINQRVGSPRPPSSDPIKVFVYWDNPATMPDIVRRCRASLQEFVDDKYELVELDAQNIADHVEIAGRVQERLANRQAHFSDYLRSRLLQEHGGLWLDSTCLLTQPLSRAMAVPSAHDAFLFTYSGSRVGSWFFWARHDSRILNAIAEVEVMWWERQDHLTNYFMWHDIVEMLYWTDSAYRQAWDQLPKVHPRPALALLAMLDKPFDGTRYDEVLAGSGIHKLTHKLPPEAFESDTFARHLLTEMPAR